MDRNLHLDVRHIDDSHPPGFGPLRSAEAPCRTVQRRARRARQAAGVVMAMVVAAAAGIGLRHGGTDGELVAVDGPVLGSEAQAANPPPPDAVD